MSIGTPVQTRFKLIAQEANFYNPWSIKRMLNGGYARHVVAAHFGLHLTRLNYLLDSVAIPGLADPAYTGNEATFYA